MHRSIKLSLHALVLAAVVAAPVTWSHAATRSVHVLVDGRDRVVSTGADTVAGVLAAGGYRTGAHDLVAPGLTATVHDGSRIVLRHARLLRLTVDGRQAQVWTTAPTVSTALADLGYTTVDFVSVSRSRRLPLTPTDIVVRTPKQLTFVHDGQRQQVTTTARTVGQMLSDLGVTVGRGDLLSTPATAAVRGGSVITLVRMSRVTVTHVDAVPFPTRTIQDAGLASGRTTVVVAGRAGSSKVTYSVIMVNGTVYGRTADRVQILRAPEQRIVRVGTKPTLASNPTPAAEQAYARSLLASYGWSDDQFSCLVTMWDHESNWRVNAANPSGAYGIPQALPGSKMGAGWQDDAEVQIKWGLGYIKSRYGSPCGAWSFWQQGSWY